MKNYLVTGGAGFIGSHLVETLLKEGHAVRVVDNFDTGKRETLGPFRGPLEVMEGSVADAGVMKKATEGIDVVFHQAARGSVPRSVEDPAGTHEANVTGTLQVLIAARDAGVQRVVCASSSSIYGETPELPKKETMPPTPMSPYGLSKLMLEYYCRLFTQVYGLETVALRYFNVFGPRQNPFLQYAAVIPLFILQMMKGKPCTIYGDGEQTRDFTYVADCVRANLLASTAAGAAGKVFNIACGGQISVNELHTELKKMIPSGVDPAYEPTRPGDIKYSFADIGRAKSDLGFTPAFSLRTGLEQTVSWFAAQTSR